MSTPIRITLVEVENFRGIKRLRFAPGARALVRIKGKTGAGKSSFLDSVEWAILGPGATEKDGVTRKGDVVRHGTPKARVSVSLDNRLQVTRTETEGGTRTLVVSRPDGSVFPRGQEAIDREINARFLDVQAFLSKDDKGLVDLVLGMVDVPIDLAKNKADRAAIEDERREINRRAKDADAELRNTPEPAPEPPTSGPEQEVSVAALMAQAEEMRKARTENDAKRLELVACERRGREQAADVELAAENVRRTQADLAKDEAQLARENTEADADLERELAAVRQRHEVSKARRVDRFAAAQKTAAADIADAEQCGKGAAEAVAVERAAYARIKAECDALTDPDLSAITAQLATVETTNREIRARNQAATDAARQRKADREKRSAAESKAADLKAQSAARTAAMDALDKARVDALATVKMPVDGLGLGDGVLTYRGTALSNLSQGERRRVAFGLLVASQPALGFVSVRDAALLDEEDVVEIGRLAAEHGLTAVVELKRDDSPDCVEFVDGEIVNTPAPTDGDPELDF